MDVIRFIPGQVVMHDRKNPQGENVLIELSPLWQDGEYHFIVKNVDYPWRAYEHVNKHGLDIDGVRRVEPVVEYNCWGWMQPPGGAHDWYKCRLIEDFGNLVQFESDIPGVGLHNAAGKVPDGRAWWIQLSSIVVGGDKPLLAKGSATTPPATTPVTTPVSTTGWVEEDDDSVGEHTLPPLPAFEPVAVVSEPQQCPPTLLPADWRAHVWDAYVRSGGEMSKLIADYKTLYKDE